jgi:hypothetical protein
MPCGGPAKSVGPVSGIKAGVLQIARGLRLYSRVGLLCLRNVADNPTSAAKQHHEYYEGRSPDMHGGQSKERSDHHKQPSNTELMHPEIGSQIAPRDSDNQ